ncbi:MULTISPECIES: hypothetical protein [Alcanivorax]|uniref:hypothetical protein n=1 Tax=Alcanivorax TaxID=59753 RepID=UPI0010615C8A|nr:MULTISPECIES: hypothetical protein [Alcanivorax]
MKKAVLMTALMVAVTGAQAVTLQSGTAGPDIVDVGGATIGGFHGPLGAPAIGVHDSGELISLQSIESFTFHDYVTSEGVDFAHHQLAPGFIHTNPQPGEEALGIGMDGIKIPDVGKDVYFGLASVEGTSANQHQAWYVGDQDGFVLPTSSTDYAAVALLALPTTSVNSPEILTGELTLNVSGTSSLSGTLTNGSGATQNNLLIQATGNDAFSGTSTYYVGTGSAPSSNGSVTGHFFGNGSTGNSALAGVAEGNSVDYVASFGGVQK